MKELIISFLSACFILFTSCGTSETKVAEPVNKVKPEIEKIWEEFTIEAPGNTMMDMKYSLKNISDNAGSWVRLNLVSMWYNF